MREDLRRGVYVEGLCEEAVSCSKQPISTASHYETIEWMEGIL